MHSLILHSCISCRPDYSRWRWLQADRGPSRGNSYRFWNQNEIVLKTPRTSSGNSLKARTKVWTLLTWLTPAPPIKASPGHNLLFYYTAIYIYLHILCIKFLGIAWNPSCISLGTNVMNTSTWVRLAAMLIGPVEVEWFPVTRAI
jgi:hypothetical protein